MSSSHTDDGSATYPRPADLDLIPFELGPGSNTGRFELTADLARHDGVLYGGTGAAAAIMAMEAATQRGTIWVVTQFVAPARVGEHINWVVHTLAQGGRIAQLQVVATVDDRTIFCALGATADPRPGGLTGQYDTMPNVTSPEDSPPLRQRPAAMELPDLGFHRNLEFREATLDAGQPSGTVALWARLTSGAELTRARVAYVADMVPMAVARGAGKWGAGFSLDNSMRFATIAPTDWVLLELHGQVASHGYGHGSLSAWTVDGTLVATGSQTANMTYMFDADDDDKLEEWRRQIVDTATP